MPGRCRTSCLWALVLTASVALAGCTSLTARIAGWYITREIDSYLDLESDQRSQVRAAVDALLVEIRRDALPKWIHLFRRARETLDEGATDAKLTALQKEFDARMDQAVEILIPPTSVILADLNDAQIDHFERRMLEKLDETYEEHDAPDPERREMLDERVIEGVEDYVGDLSDAQRRVILAKVHSLPDERPVQYRVGLQRIQAGADFLRAHPSAADIAAELERLWDTRYEVLGPGRGKQARRAEQREVLLTIDATLTREQRDEGVETINELIRKTQRFVLAGG